MMHALFREGFVSFRMLTLVTAAAVRLAGQGVAPVATVATPASAPSTVIMSPFEVRSPQDHGYRVGAAITGTGTAGLIKDTPLNISIVSQEFIADQGGNQLIDVLRTASSVALQVKDESMILIRG